MLNYSRFLKRLIGNKTIYYRHSILEGLRFPIQKKLSKKIWALKTIIQPSRTECFTCWSRFVSKAIISWLRKVRTTALMPGPFLNTSIRSGYVNRANDKLFGAHQNCPLVLKHQPSLCTLTFHTDFTESHTLCYTAV